MKSKIFPIILIALVACLIFFKIFTRGQYPVPGDLLVSFYFPWYSGGWQGYNPWTTHKELLGADSIRQIYPWKEFAAAEFKKGQFPLWNPYTFSGQPLAANFQSSVYYPLNILYFPIDPKNAWIILVILQPFLGGIFMYMLVRSFKRSAVASMFAATAFMFSSYLITWMENGNISNSYIWLPLAFWSIIKYFEKPQFRFLLLLSISLALSILAGHPQTAIYLYLATFIFWVYKTWEQKSHYFKSQVIFMSAALSSFLVSAIQIIPTYYFYKVSPISLPFSREVFDRAVMPYKNLVTFFASDFFGHPANNNFWSQTYGDFTPYFGVIPLVFSLWAVFKLWKNKFVRFLALTSVIFIFSALPGPITAFIKFAKIPLLSATTPARFISISLFLLIILSAFGIEDFLKNVKNSKYQKNFVKFLVPILIVYVFLWLFATFGAYFLSPGEVWQVNLAVTRRNLILPSAMFLSVLFLSLGLIYINVIKKFGFFISVTALFFVTFVGAVYYTNKFLPTAPKSFIFPPHPLFDWLKNNADLDRFYGGGTAHIDFNFPTHYEIYGAEGYDTLRLERYAELLASSFTGSVPKTYLRSDGVFPVEENGYRRRLFELLGVKYLLDKDDTPKTGQDWHYGNFPGDSVEGFWQYDKFQVYKRSPVLPRVFLTTKYYVARNDEEIIEKIYDRNYDLEQIILEKNPPIEIIDMDQKIIIPRVESYEPNSIKVQTTTGAPSLLFISDSYDKDWNVYVDGQKSELLRAHFAFRAVAVPSGAHEVVFKYQPRSFAIGASTTVASIAALVLLSLYLYRKKKF